MAREGLVVCKAKDWPLECGVYAVGSRLCGTAFSGCEESERGWK